MRSLSFLVIALFYYLPLVVADRTTNAHNTPTVCITEPIATGSSVTLKRVRRNRDGHAHPEILHNSLPGRELSKRSGVVTFDNNCNNPPPANSGYKPSNGFPTRKSVIQQAYTDAVALANAAANVGENSLGFTHYFGGAQTDTQHTHFQGMMSAITSDTQYFSVQFECSGTAPDCEGDTVAFTDARAGGATDQKIINICPPFWTAINTRFLLYDSSKGASPGVPYRDNSGSGWCNKDNQGNSRPDCQFYATAGHSILHELTHLDALANQAGLSAPTSGTDAGLHGTDDAQEACELLGARDWLTQYKANSEKTSPDYNAESYAAAATELYFMNLCSFNEIRPLVAPPASSAAPAPASATPAPTPVAPPPPPPLPPPPPYATGTCSFHLQEWQDCEDDSKNLFAIVNMVDNDKNDIGDTQTDPAKNPLGDPINTSDPYSFTSKLPLPLVIVGEHENDYVQFTYGSLQWTSRTTNGPATCSNGGWNPKDGPICGTRFGITNAENQMDCSFPC